MILQMQQGDVASAIGQTPLIKIVSLSQRTGNEIFGKAEFLNPGGSIKDRTALGIIERAEQEQKLKPGFTIVEGTAGNTGIGIATVAAQRDYKCLIVMPNNQSQEKYSALRALGVELVTVDPCPFTNPNHFYHTAQRISQTKSQCFWADQFENLANFKKHHSTTGPEIWQQTGGEIAAFMCSVGTGGGLAGVSRFLKEQNPNVHIQLVDPFGSGLFDHFTCGELKSSGTSITEGIGIMRLTANFKEARVDSAIRIDDQDMISMLYHLAKHDGLLVGTSAALNVCAAYKFAQKNPGKNLKIVTILGDSALRYQSRIFSKTFLAEKNLSPKSLES